MKKLLSVICIVFLLCGCGGNGGTTEGGEGKAFCSVLNVYNTGEYINEDVLKQFEEDYDVRVNYSLFASNEEMFTKLMGGTVYDLIVPSDYMIEKLIEEGMLQKIDTSKVTNFSSIADSVLHKDFDMNNEYSVPYFWGNVGIVYDKTLIDQTDVESQGWEVMKNEKYKGMIYMYDSERDSFMIALKALGYSMNTTDEKELEDAYNWLIDLDNKMDPAYVTDEAIDGLAYGEKAMGVMYSGDAAYILSENENMAFFAPEEGTNVWVDAFVMHKDSTCQDLAYDFINYFLEYENAYENSSYIGYAAVREDVLNDLAADEFEGNAAYVPRTGNQKDEVFHNNDTARKIISEYWVKVKNN